MAGKSARDESEIITTASRKRTFLIIIAVLLILLGLAAFGLAIKQTNEAASEISKDSNNGRSETSVMTENGQIMIKEGELTDKFPKDVTVYKGAEVLKSTEATDGNTAILKTSDSVQKVTTFYLDDLKKNGWSSIESNVIEDSSLITAKKERKQVVITAKLDKTDNKTEINIAIGAST